MTTTRILPAVLVVLAIVGKAPAQYGAGQAPFGPAAGLVPSVLPVGYTEATEPAPTRKLPTGSTQTWLPPAGMPAGRPPAAQYTALDRVTAPVRQASAEAVPSDPVGTLTGQPATPPAMAGLPPGAYPSPYFTDGPGCCGPLGRNGRIGYELYSYTGPTIAFGEGGFTRRLNTGWMVGGGGRSLFFNPTHDAAWVMDMGLSYQYNRGEFDDPLRFLIRQPPATNPLTGETGPAPDRGVTASVRALHRTNFNFGFGRDWWLWGAGSVGQGQGWNLRIGGLLGGRWGTAHVDLVPVNEPNGYARRQNVTNGLFLAGHTTTEIPMGTWILFAGLRVEYGYDWTNIVPPQNGNLSNLNILLTAGIRF